MAMRFPQTTMRHSHYNNRETHNMFSPDPTRRGSRRTCPDLLPLPAMNHLGPDVSPGQAAKPVGS